MKKNEKTAHLVRTTHPLYLHLRYQYVLDPKKRKTPVEWREDDGMEHLVHVVFDNQKLFIRCLLPRWRYYYFAGNILVLENPKHNSEHDQY